MTDIVKLESLSPYAQRRSLEVPRMTFTQWRELGRSLHLCGSAQKWWFGDWVIAGEAAYGDKAVQVAADTLQIESGTMATVVSVCKRFPPKSRTHNVGFEMYREVWPLKEGQWEGWLIKAELNNWNRAKLREELKAAGLRRKYEKEDEQKAELIKRTMKEMLESFEADNAKAMSLIPDVVKICVTIAKEKSYDHGTLEELDAKIEEVRYALLLLQEDAQALIKSLK